MFKKFNEKTDVTSVNAMKSSAQRGLRNKILEQFPNIADHIDEILPKKEPLKAVKCRDHIEIVANSSGELRFFRQRDGPYMPTLKLLHKYPFILPLMQVDKGAIKFVLSGANIMCPGLTSPGAKMSDVPTDSVVAVMAEGKQHALGIGYTKMSSADILSTNKGIGVDNIHYLNDQLWSMAPVK
ncbi:malignant T-cell-amplified sequence 1-like [Tubulanus polymorphus]|uniref:malignant T-cell-amplified sequence 1-like n=1 Tax=Tubulanus polymorphus TaxID=672921 RepID=UPI003DA584C3